MGNTWNREGTKKDKSLFQWAVKGLAKVTRKQMWFELTPAGTPPEKINLKPNALLVNLWKDLTPKQMFRSSPPAPSNAHDTPAQTEASEI